MLWIRLVLLSGYLMSEISKGLNTQQLPFGVIGPLPVPGNMSQYLLKILLDFDLKFSKVS